MLGVPLSHAGDDIRICHGTALFFRRSQRLAPRRAKNHSHGLIGCWRLRWPQQVSLQHFFGECSLTLKYHACHMMLDFIYSIVMYCHVLSGFPFQAWISSFPTWPAWYWNGLQEKRSIPWYAVCRQQASSCSRTENSRQFFFLLITFLGHRCFLPDFKRLQG